MTAGWMGKRWCVVEPDDQHDLFIGDPWHTHLVDINLRLDIPVERTLCGDLLPAQPIFSELLRSILPRLCPACVSRARSERVVGAARQPALASEKAAIEKTASLRSGATTGGYRQIVLDVVQGDHDA